MNTDVIKIMEKQHLKKFDGLLLPGETVTHAVGADHDITVGALALTDKRVIYAGANLKKKNVSIGLSKISQVKYELGGFISNSYIILEYSGGEAKFRVHGKDETKYMANAITLATL